LNSVLQKRWEEGIAACFKVPSQHLPGSLMATCQNSQQSSSDSIEGPSKYQAGILTTTALYEI
jgi:hypothetical protein